MLVAALVAMAVPALAADVCQGVPGNVIVNCGFETGDFTGWTQGGNTVGQFVYSGAPWAYSGNYGAALGPNGSDGYLSQSFYGNTLTFAFRDDPYGWALDSVAVTAFVNCGGSCMTYQVSFWLANIADANGNTTPNDFTVWWNGVDVGPSLVNSPAFGYTQFGGFVDGTAPEPGSLVLLGSGVLGLAGVVRRKLML